LVNVAAQPDELAGPLGQRVEQVGHRRVTAVAG
jgi:hypothetical protein